MSLVRIPTTGNQVTKHSTDYGWSQQSTELSFFLKNIYLNRLLSQAKNLLWTKKSHRIYKYEEETIYNRRKPKKSPKNWENNDLNID